MSLNESPVWLGSAWLLFAQWTTHDLKIKILSFQCQGFHFHPIGLSCTCNRLPRDFQLPRSIFSENLSAALTYADSLCCRQVKTKRQKKSTICLISYQVYESTRARWVLRQWLVKQKFLFFLFFSPLIQGQKKNPQTTKHFKGQGEKRIMRGTWGAGKTSA